MKKFNKMCESILNESTFKKGDKVIISKLGEFTADDFSMSEREYQDLLTHEGESATIESMATDGYWNVKFNDGTVADALSEYHISKTAKVSALQILGIGIDKKNGRYFDLKNPDTKNVYTAYVKFPSEDVEEIDVNAQHDTAARDIVKRVLQPEAKQYEKGGKIIELTQRFGLYK